MAYDVIIAGAGPVGLFLAAELGLRGASVLVLERAASPDTPLRSGWLGLRGLNRPSLQALDRRGLTDAVREVALEWWDGGPEAPRAVDALKDEKPRPRLGGHFAGIGIDGDKVDLSLEPYAVRGPSPTVAMVDLAALETVLARRAESLGVAIRRGAAVADVRQDEGGVEVDAGGETFRAGWLVGCDGGRSVVRKRAGFAFEGTDAQLTGYVAALEVADPEKIRPGVHLTPNGMYMFSVGGPPSRGSLSARSAAAAMGPTDCWITFVDFDGGAYDRDREVTAEHLQSVLRRVSGMDVTINALRLASTYTDRARQATTYRKGRVLLAGDAAHIHPPFGGQGLNTGLMDALNLGWKLAATVKGSAPDALLDSYTTERHPAGAWALDWTRAQVAVMRPDPWGHAIAGLIRDLAATRDGATYFAGKIGGFSRRYDLPGDHPLVGRVAPDFAFADGSRLGDLLRDGGAVLLDLRGDARWGGLEEGYDGRLKVVSAEATDSMRVAALFIRPDGVVAWAVDDDAPPDGEALDAVVRTWLGEPVSSPAPAGARPLGSRGGL